MKEGHSEPLTLGGIPKTVRDKAGLSSSGVKSSTANIKATAGLIYWISAWATAAAVFGLYDAASDSGTYIWSMTLPADGYGHWIFDPPLECATGIELHIASGTVGITVGYV